MASNSIRNDSSKEKILKNKEVVKIRVASHHTSASNRGSGNKLDLRMRIPMKIIPASLSQDNNNEEVDISERSTLPLVMKIPPYTTWVHTARNQLMTKEQSVKGKCHIYYDQDGGVTMIDSDEDTIAPREFSDDEKRIIRMVSQGVEPSERVLQTLARAINRTTSEIREFIRMKEKDDEEMNRNILVHAELEHDNSMVLEKSLASNMDTFDTLFCRRCLVFDCRLHGNGQPIITPAERLEGGPEFESEQDEEPCSDQCYNLSFENSVIGADSACIITWKPLEKDLYLKGVQIFGRNSCLIARNLLRGLKTCMEVYRHMQDDGPNGSSTTIDHHTGQGNVASSSGRKGKGKKFGGHPRRGRRIGDGKQSKSNKQYTPCGCNSVCGKDCSCLNNFTCCEKYCGCLKSCKNRFRGCHCAKSQCRSQQCPCFAAGRECDPDICRNCWVSCGGGSLGEPQRREGQCGNMRLLLRQHQRILLGKSNIVDGWGAFVKNTVEKDEYLGEYTGELISQKEADLRGKLYDDAKPSFLFNLNDEYVIDALRQRNKLKFANHSPNPNCQASIIKVRGDHRVGIFAKERIEAGEEIFYDYCYGPEQSPYWARKANDENESPSGPPQARSKKPQAYDPKEGPSVPPQARAKKPPPHR